MPEYPRNSLPDYYQVLEINTPPAQVTPEIVKRQFRKVSKKIHPDPLASRLGRDPSEAEKARSTRDFQIVNDAYSTLLDPKKKRAYDLSRSKKVEDNVNIDRAIESFIQKLTDEMILSRSLRYYSVLNELSLEELKTIQTNLDGYKGKMRETHADVIAEFTNCIDAKGKYKKDFWKVFKAAKTGNYKGVDAVGSMIAEIDWETYQKEFPVSRVFQVRFNEVLNSFVSEVWQLKRGMQDMLVKELLKKFRS